MTRKPILIAVLGLLIAGTAYFLRYDAFTAGGSPGAAESGVGAGAPAASVEEPTPSWSDADWDLFSGKVRAALDHGVDTLPLGASVAMIGRTFVGTPYVPHTLEAPGPEHVVIDFHELDCVTFVETALTTARFARQPDAAALLEQRGRAEERYEALLRDLRYRGGKLEGYPSRLHYFTDWIADGEAKGLVRDVTRDLGGVRDTEPIDFMSTHVDAYRQLGEDTSAVRAIRATEARLSTAGRWFVPADRIADVADAIQDGDVIAATSTVPGLDVAHTGLALHVNGELHLMHAPLVGDSVQISEQTLAARIQRIGGQDGIIVARPVDDGAR